MIIVAGPNGSGKTSLTSQLLLHEWLRDCVYINPDEIAQKKFGDWNSPDAVRSAAHEATSLREVCLSERKNFIFETVFSSAEKLNFLRRGHDAGYFVRLFFIATLSPVINAARIASRVMKGGHDVPITKIISRYTKSIANCAAGVSFVDRAYLFDNSENDKAPRLLFRTQNGEIAKIYDDIPAWAGIIKSNIEHQHKNTIVADLGTLIKEDMDKAAAFVVRNGIDPHEESLKRAGLNGDEFLAIRQELHTLAQRPDAYGIMEEDLKSWGEKHDVARVRIKPTPEGPKSEIVYDNF